MSRSEKCPVKGCPGVARIETDGNGHIVNRCDCCEKRSAWKEKNVPYSRRYVCEICAGAFTTVKSTGTPKYCAACRPLAERKHSLDARARKRAAPSVRALRSA